MKEKEIAELRRRFKSDRTAITHIHGCYVGEKKEIISTFSQSLALLPQEESERLLALLKKSLSGTLGRNLLDICFTTAQVADSDEHRLLMALRSSRLTDGEAREEFYRRVIGGTELEGNYLILLGSDSYDVPYRTADDVEQADASSEVFTYFVCALCPVKPTKPALSYFARENEFHTLAPDWVVAQPEIGFTFPAFDDRSTNIYNALYYSRDVGEIHPEFVEGIFRTQPIMPAPAQKENFRSLLQDSLGDECDMKTVRAVDDQFRDLIETHKAAREKEPLALSKGAVRSVLRSCGVDARRADSFERQYAQTFGDDTDLAPRNVVDPKQIEITTPDVTIRVAAGHGDLVDTRVIDGKKYILIRADDGVEVDGVAIQIK